MFSTINVSYKKKELYMKFLDLILVQVDLDFDYGLGLRLESGCSRRLCVDGPDSNGPHVYCEIHGKKLILSILENKGGLISLLI